MRKDYSCRDEGTITAWLLRCCDTGCDVIDLDGKEAQQLGPPSRDGGNDKALIEKNRPVSL